MSRKSRETQSAAQGTQITTVCPATLDAAFNHDELLAELDFAHRELVGELRTRSSAPRQSGLDPASAPETSCQPSCVGRVDAAFGHDHIDRRIRWARERKAAGELAVHDLALIEFLAQPEQF